MTLRIVKEEFPGGRQGVVVIEGDTQEEVMTTAARQMALDAAGRHISRAGLSGQESAYPVDANGETSDDLILGRGGAVDKYRCDYKCTAGL
jgi:hypothetical protein